MGFQETWESRVTTPAERAFGVSARLWRGEEATEAFTAIWEKQAFAVMEAEGFATSGHLRAFQFEITAMKIGGQQIEPRKGDRVVITENETEAKFEIAPMGELPAVELMPGGYRWKVRTKRV